MEVKFLYDLDLYLKVKLPYFWSGAHILCWKWITFFRQGQKRPMGSNKWVDLDLKKKKFWPERSLLFITKTTEYLDMFSLAWAQILFSAYIFVKTFFILRSRSIFGKNQCQQFYNKDTEGHWGKINGLTFIFKKYKCSS